jgi:hypothetical protein
VWSGGFVLNTAQHLRDVSGAGGLVVGGGDGLLMLRPGSENWMARPRLDDLLGPIVRVAAEQRRPWRYALSTPGGITMFGLPDDRKLTLTSETPEVQVTHMAWARLGEESVLYLRWTDGSVGRLRLDIEQIETLQVMPMDAIASDANGALAMVAVRCAAQDAHALWTRDGIRLEERPVTVTGASGSGDAGARVHLAVADVAIAWAIDGQGTFTSRGVDEDFVACEALGQGGPVAFQGSAADAAVLGVRHDKLVCAFDRVDVVGGVQRIVEIEAEGADAPSITALQWDQSRRTIWAASPQAGLFRSTEPKGKTGEKLLVN